MKNIIITGGGLHNKGAQAMTFICVQEFVSRFPDHRIILMSDGDFFRPESEKSMYSFDVLQEPGLKSAFFKLGGIYRLFAKIRQYNKEEYTLYDDLYNNTDLIVDISGYALGSNWSNQSVIQYLSRFVFAYAYSIPSYIMPQSFGPFDFRGKKGILINWLIKKFLKKVKTIFAREEGGYLALKDNYKIVDNVKRSCDMVLLSESYDISRIFVKKPLIKDVLVDKKTVAVIPNTRMCSFVDSHELSHLYQQIINELLRLGKKVCILYHSSEDYSFCENLFSLYNHSDDVRFITEELSCIEFNHFISKCEFAVASRYHSIVHAYKNSIPCIVLGWSEKYTSLTKLFSQKEYAFDIREMDIESRVESSIITLNNSLYQEKEIIQKCLNNVRDKNLFDDMVLKARQ